VFHSGLQDMFLHAMYCKQLFFLMNFVLCGIFCDAGKVLCKHDDEVRSSGAASASRLMSMN
jgi:hypothetical protein